PVPSAAPPAEKVAAAPPPAPAPEAPARRVIKPVVGPRPSFSVPPAAPKTPEPQVAEVEVATPPRAGAASEAPTAPINAAPVSVPPVREERQPTPVQVTPPSVPAPGSIASASQQQRGQAPSPPIRRIITPQTGPRPVY